MLAIPAGSVPKGPHLTEDRVPFTGADLATEPDSAA